eukprot:symbB.v1.2.007922.t3/scaffold495.1/size259991/6
MSYWQRSEHRKTLMFLEQLILQHKAHKNMIQLQNVKDGLDFFFHRDRDAQDFLAFLKNWVVAKHQESKHLVSHNAQNTTYRFKRTTCEVEMPVDPMVSAISAMKFGEELPSAGRSERLSFTVEPQLLRAAPLQVVLSGWCKHWKGLHVESGEELFELSRPAQSIDVFLSHDWETSRWMKLMAMLLVFNSPAAAMAALLASIATGVAQVSGIVGDRLWFFPSYWVYLFVLCFWQRIRGVCRHRMVFMDKLCINQKDDKMKEVGILGLGAFVQRSDKLLVLWWCAYEMGCFFSREEGQLEILPVKVAYILFLTAIFWHAIMAALRFAAIWLLQGGLDENSPALLLSLSAFCGPVTLVVLPLMNYLGMSIMRDVHQLPDQLQNFRLQDAQCFCCSHHHLHPETGQELICDRELVYETLSELYSASQKESGVDPLEKFNRRVRDRLGPKILRRVGVRFPFKYVLFIVMVEVCPVCPDDLVYLPKKMAQALGGLPPLMLCTKAAAHLVLLDPASMRSVEVAATEYWKKPFHSVAIPSKMTEFIVLDVDEEVSGHARGSRGVPCEVEVARASDFGKNDDRLLLRSHLGGILRVGDSVMGYDLRTLHLGVEDEELSGVPLEVYLVKKKRPERAMRQKRPGKGSKMAQQLRQAKEQKEAQAEAVAPEEEEGKDEAEEEVVAMKEAADALLSQFGAPSGGADCRPNGEEVLEVSEAAEA